MDTFTQADTTTTTKTDVINTLTFSDFVKHLIDTGSGLVHYTTPDELASFGTLSEFTGLPIYKCIRVYLNDSDKANNKGLYMVFVDNGAVFYHHGDVLDRVPFEGHFDDIETIFHDYFLDGTDDTAGFAGFFLLKEEWIKA
jgi:hypothetical protein